MNTFGGPPALVDSQPMIALPSGCAAIARTSKLLPLILGSSVDPAARRLRARRPGRRKAEDSGRNGDEQIGWYRRIFPAADRSFLREARQWHVHERNPPRERITDFDKSFAGDALDDSRCNAMPAARALCATTMQSSTPS